MLIVLNINNLYFNEFLRIFTNFIFIGSVYAIVYILIWKILVCSLLYVISLYNFTESHCYFWLVFIHVNLRLKMINTVFFEYFTVHCTLRIKFLFLVTFDNITTEKLIHLAVAVEGTGRNTFIYLWTNHYFVWDHIQ